MLEDTNLSVEIRSELHCFINLSSFLLRSKHFHYDILFLVYNTCIYFLLIFIKCNSYTLILYLIDKHNKNSAKLSISKLIIN